MDQYSPNSKDTETSTITLTAEELAEWEIDPKMPTKETSTAPAQQQEQQSTPKHIKEAWGTTSTLLPGFASSPSPPRPRPTYRQTGRTAGRQTGQVHPGYGDSHRLLPGHAGPEYPAVPDLLEQDQDRANRRLASLQRGEREVLSEVKNGTAELNMGFHPALQAVLSPMLRMADNELEAAMELPRLTKRKGLPLVSRNTGLEANLEVYIVCVRFIFV